MVENLELRDGEEVVLDVRCGCIKPNEDFATKTNEGFLHEVGAFVILKQKPAVIQTPYNTAN
jgi:hypothetical protein